LLPVQTDAPIAVRQDVADDADEAV